MNPFSWHCPFCNRDTIITDERFSSTTFGFDDGNKYGKQYLKAFTIVCPNPECKEYALTVTLHDQTIVNNTYVPAPAKRIWNLIPAAEIKVFPNYIPSPIIADYQEACLIRDLSPKASATLSRRCLQGMIRDYWKISKSRLIDEIEAIKEKLDPLTWDAIDSVRHIGNIGAHMEKDINMVVEVDENEAALLISLIETLLTEWYVARQEREERMAKIIATREVKKAIKISANK